MTSISIMNTALQARHSTADCGRADVRWHLCNKLRSKEDLTEETLHLRCASEDTEETESAPPYYRHELICKRMGLVFVVELTILAKPSGH